MYMSSFSFLFGQCGKLACSSGTVASFRACRLRFLFWMLAHFGGSVMLLLLNRIFLRLLHSFECLENGNIFWSLSRQGTAAKCLNARSLAVLLLCGLGKQGCCFSSGGIPMVCLTPRWSRQCCQDDADCEHGPRQLHGNNSRRTDFGSSDWPVPADPSGYPQSGTTCQHLPGPEVPK